MFKICDEPGSLNQACLLYIYIYDELVSRNLVNRGGGGLRQKFKIYDEQESPHEGTCQVFKINDEPESPNEGACLRYMMNWNRRMKESVFLTIYDEPESPHEGVFKIYDEPESSKEGGVFKGI